MGCYECTSDCDHLVYCNHCEGRYCSNCFVPYNFLTRFAYFDYCVANCNELPEWFQQNPVAFSVDLGKIIKYIRLRRDFFYNEDDNDEYNDVIQKLKKLQQFFMNNTKITKECVETVFEDYENMSVFGICDPFIERLDDHFYCKQCYKDKQMTKHIRQLKSQIKSLLKYTI